MAYRTFVQYIAAVLLFINGCFTDELQDKVMVEYLESSKHLQGKAEIVFLLDRSGSVGSANFEIEKGFVESFLTHIVVDVNASRVAVISYSNTAVLHIDYLREPKTKCFLSQELQDVVFIDSRATNIAAALDKAHLVFQNARPNVNKVVVLISDGFATAGGNPVPHAERLKSSGVEIFCFGVGKVMQNELELLASSEKHVYRCSEYKDFQRLARKIRGDPHETSWSGQATTPNCDHMCDSPYKDEPNDPGCCDHNARCSCALLSGMHTCVCGPGYFGLSGLAGHCRACPKGTYKSKLEPSRQCTSCPKSATTDREASTSLRDCFCKEGYEGDPSKGIECTLVKCPPLQNPTNGFLLGSCQLTYGSECHFMCEEDYELVDKMDDIRRCQRDGTWSGKTSRCRRIQCNAPSSPWSGVMKCDNRDRHYVGNKCWFSCHRGYIMEGSKERECLPSKRWSGNEVRCIPMSCELPPPFKYGQVYGCKTNVKPLYQETCAFRCNDGFELDGPTYLYCAEDGKLKSFKLNDLAKPSCRDIQPPEITCPEARVISAEIGKDGAYVHWEIPHPTDNSGLVPKLVSYPAIKPPAYLPINRYTIQYVAIDHVGLKSYCNFEIVVYDDEAPTVLKCPSRIEISSDDVVEPAYWEEPSFVDNSRRAVRIRQSHSPGYAFSPGRHTVRYEAFDENNNMAECVFEVIMTRNTCPYYPPPANGALSCDDMMYGEICQVLCNEKYDFVEKPAEWYICNSQSKWMSIPDYMPFPWPDCAKPALPGKVRHMMRGFYYAGDCNDPQVQIQIKKMFLHQLMTKFQKGGVCVHQGTCTLNTVRVKCGQSTDPLVNRRVRRDVWEHAFREELELEFEITIDVDQELNDTEAVLENFLETIQNLKWDADEDFLQTTTSSPFTDGIHAGQNYTRNTGTVVITEEKTEMVCKPGAVLNQDLCVLCAPGTYYDSSMQECVDCPLGHYQEEEGRLQCEKCSTGKSTEYRRSRNETDCKGICLPGTYSQNGLETCMACPIGTYQEHVGQHLCELCPGRTTTATVQSISQSDCKETCDPGSFSESGLKPCDLCPVGYYQPSSGQRACLECPTNFSTFTAGSMDASQCLDLDPCSDESLCWNGGECKRIGREAICICLLGYEGKHCEEDVDECVHEPCYNGGLCFNVDGSFYCNCSDGFTGPQCEVEVNECSSSPCLNNGTCLDKVNDYACVCPAGYEGRSCETEQEVCSHDIICLNGGVCVDESNNGSSVCSCRPGFSGVDCALDINECEEATCYNNASCVDAIASYTCICALGYTGASCETEVNECESNQCWSGSTCRDLIGAYECLCPPGWGGTFCETKLDDNFLLNFPESTATIANMATMQLNSPLSDVTVSMWVQTTDTEHSGTPMSYAVASATTTDGEETVVDNALTISDCSGIQVYVNNEPLVTDVQVADGQWHHLAFSWSSQNSGEWTLYKDGQLQTNGTHLRPQDVVPGGGTVVIGQEQDTVGGGFSPVETFTGNITRVNVWNSYFSKSNITRLCQLDDDIPGKVIAWPDFLHGLKGNVNVLRNERPVLEVSNLTNT